MKNRFFITFFAFIFVSGAVSAQNVSRDPQTRNVLIEDFTGIHCGNCPRAHKLLEHLILAQPDKINCVAVHSGYFASPYRDEPDYRTEEGEELGTYYGLDSWPSGLINRKEYSPYGLLLGTSSWTDAARAITTLSAPVNIDAVATYDSETRLISADVEMYFTEDVPAEDARLSLLLTESEVIGPQSGGNMDDEYIHRHMLRDYITPLWGDAIEQTAEGSLVKVHYEYTLPDDYNGVVPDAENMTLVSFVSGADHEVLNVCSARVSCPGMTRPLAATLEAYKITPIRNYAFNFFECYLVNEGTEPITSATFSTCLNEGDTETCTWTGNINYKERAYIRIPVSWTEGQRTSDNEYEVSLLALNGQDYQGGTLSGVFNGMIETGNKVMLTLTTDKHASDNTYRLLDADGNIVQEYGPYADGEVATYEETLEMPLEGYYCFEITDAWGDGMTKNLGKAKWYQADGETLITQNSDIAAFGYRIFFHATDAAGISIVSSDADKDSAVYNVAGQRISVSQPGQLYIRNGRKCINNRNH